MTANGRPAGDTEAMAVGNGLVAYLVLGDRDTKTQREADAEVRRLRRAMADAHPDRGGTDAEFISLNLQYEAARAARDDLGAAS
jgi:hypothetical protein